MGGILTESISFIMNYDDLNLVTNVTVNWSELKIGLKDYVREHPDDFKIVLDYVRSLSPYPPPPPPHPTPDDHGTSFYSVKIHTYTQSIKQSINQSIKQLNNQSINAIKNSFAFTIMNE